jgi:hypothetical protein
MNSTIYGKIAAQILRDTHGYTTKDKELQNRDSKFLKVCAAADLAAQNIVTCGSPLDTDRSDERISLAISNVQEQATARSSNSVLDDFEQRACEAAQSGDRATVNDLFLDAMSYHMEAGYIVGLFVGLHFAQALASLPAPATPQRREHAA